MCWTPAYAYVSLTYSSSTPPQDTHKKMLCMQAQRPAGPESTTTSQAAAEILTTLASPRLCQLNTVESQVKLFVDCCV